MLISRILYFLINIVFTVVGFLLGLRIILRFFWANPSTPFVSWVYESSDSLLAPFAGIFPVSRIDGGFIVDFPAIFAVIIYAFIGYLILEVVEMIALRSEERIVRRSK